MRSGKHFDYYVILIANNHNFLFLKFQAVTNKKHESVKTLIAENVIIDEKTKSGCQINGDTETKTIISNEILKRVSNQINCF